MNEQGKEILNQLNRWAASDQPQDHEQLLAGLNSQRVLTALQTAEEYDTSLPRSVEVGRVVKTLMTSPHPVARQSLLRLVQAQEFLKFEVLQELLVVALVALRPLPPEAVAYLDHHSTPDATALHLVMTTLAANESDPALLLFERKIADTEHDVEDRAIWLQVEYLIRRNDVPILRSYRRMIVDGTVPPDMQMIALDSLCAYHPEIYLACTKPEPPPRHRATGEAKQLLREILDHAERNLSLSAELYQSVRRVRLEIGDEENA